MCLAALAKANHLCHDDLVSKVRSLMSVSRPIPCGNIKQITKKHLQNGWAKDNVYWKDSYWLNFSVKFSIVSR